MEIAALVLSILALILGSVGCFAGGWAVVQVLAWQRSTHRITQMPVIQDETQVTTDLPQHIIDQLPSPPEKLSASDYLKWEAARQAEEDFYNE